MRVERFHRSSGDTPLSVLAECFYCVDSTGFTLVHRKVVLDDVSDIAGLTIPFVGLTLSTNDRPGRRL